MAKVKKTIIRNDNTINAVYILKIFKNNIINSPLYKKEMDVMLFYRVHLVFVINQIKLSLISIYS